MSLLFVYYNRQNPIASESIHDPTNDFSLNQTRKVNIFKNDKIFIAADQQWAKYNTIAENEDNSKIICLSGNISDYDLIPDQLIRKGHTFVNVENPAEILLHAWEEYREKIIDMVSGSFAFIIYDKKKEELIAANDNFGIYPLFVYKSEEKIIFCNEIEPILKCRDIKKSIDYSAISQYITSGAPLSGKTFIKEITNLEPSSILTINNNAIRQSVQHPFSNISISGQSPAENATRIFNCVKKFTEERTAFFPDIRCMLTGGMDTRFILGCIPPEKLENVKFITFITPGLPPAKDRDVIVAKMLADKFHLNHEITEMHSWSDQWRKEFEISLLDLWRERTDYKIMGGIYGGEFLNGGCFQIIPSYLNNIKSGFFTRLFTREPSSNHIYKKALHENLYPDAINSIKIMKEHFFNLKTENKKMLFTIQYLTRSFYSQIYGGINAKWQSPWMFPLKADSAFTDKHFLTTLLSIPLHQLIDERQPIYNHIYTTFLNHLTDVPVNSAFGNINGSCMKFIDSGTEPRLIRKIKNETILQQYIMDDLSWDRKIFKKEYILKNIHNNKVISTFFDLETWFRHADIV